jgi:hypothetical protein
MIAVLPGSVSSNLVKWLLFSSRMTSLGTTHWTWATGLLHAGEPGHWKNTHGQFADSS